MRLNKLGGIIPIIGMMLVFLSVASPAHSASGAVGFYDASTFGGDYLEWSRQGARVGLEVRDSDLDTITKFEGTAAEQYVLNAERTFFLMEVPVADRNDDGFVNQRDIAVTDANGSAIDVDRASIDGRVDLVGAYTGTVYVSYWAAGPGNTGDRVSVNAGRPHRIHCGARGGREQQRRVPLGG